MAGYDIAHLWSDGEGMIHRAYIKQNFGTLVSSQSLDFDYYVGLLKIESGTEYMAGA